MFWRDLRIVFKAIWLNLFAYVLLLLAGTAALRLSASYLQASLLDLLVDSFFMSVLERVVEAGDGVMPAILTFVLPLLTVVILGEGALRVLSLFIARGKNREEWNQMVVKTLSDHIVVCGIGELGKAMVKRLHADHARDQIVLMDLRQGISAETGMTEDNFVFIQGDMTNLEALKKVNIQKAKLILLPADLDAVNLEAAYKILQLNPNAQMWIRLHHSGLADLMDLSSKPNLHFFSPYLQAAEIIAQSLYPEAETNGNKKGRS
jgi:hypothetical protein